MTQCPYIIIIKSFYITSAVSLYIVIRYWNAHVVRSVAFSPRMEVEYALNFGSGWPGIREMDGPFENSRVLKLASDLSSVT